MYTNDHYPEPEDREPWEPRNPFYWLDQDRLSRQLFQREEFSERIADQVYSAWLRLPSRFRKQVWREREIAASL
jgi:hypothetical protein